MRLKAQLLLVADLFTVLTEMPDSRLSRLLFGNGNRIALLRRGADMQSANVEDALCRLSGLWPEGESWPSQVPRPAPLALQPLPPPKSRQRVRSHARQK